MYCIKIKISICVALSVFISGCFQKHTQDTIAKEESNFVEKRTRSKVDYPVPPLLFADLITGEKFTNWKKGFGFGLSPDECRNITEYDKMFEDCSLVPICRGTAAQISICISMGSHTCDVEYFVFSDKINFRKSVKSLHFQHIDNRFELDGSHEVLFEDMGLVVENGEEVHLGTNKISLATGKSEHFLDEFSCILSPHRRWLICRNRAAGVVKVSLENKEKQSLFKTEIPSADIALGGSMGDYPEPVNFLSNKKISFNVRVKESSSLFTYENKGEFKFELDWNE